MRAILGRVSSSKPRPRPRSIASVVAVHVRAPVCPPLPLRAACADVRACAAALVQINLYQSQIHPDTALVAGTWLVLEDLSLVKI